MLSYNKDFGRVKDFTVPPPYPRQPEGPVCLLVPPDTGSILGQSRGHAQGVRTWDLPGTGGGGDMAPPQLMSEPFPRDKVEMTRNMSCGEATSLQHNKNTWLNPNYNPARRTSANQHDDEQWPIYSQQPSPALLIYNLTKTQGGRAGKI